MGSLGRTTAPTFSASGPKSAKVRHIKGKFSCSRGPLLECISHIAAPVLHPVDDGVTFLKCRLFGVPAVIDGHRDSPGLRFQGSRFPHVGLHWLQRKRIRITP